MAKQIPTILNALFPSGLTSPDAVALAAFSDTDVVAEAIVEDMLMME